MATSVSVPVVLVVLFVGVYICGRRARRTGQWVVRIGDEPPQAALVIGAEDDVQILYLLPIQRHPAPGRPILVQNQ